MVGINRPYHHNVLSHPNSCQDIINSPHYNITHPFLRVQAEVSPKPENSKYTLFLNITWEVIVLETLPVNSQYQWQSQTGLIPLLRTFSTSKTLIENIYWTVPSNSQGVVSNSLMDTLSAMAASSRNKQCLDFHVLLSTNINYKFLHTYNVSCSLVCTCKSVNWSLM